MRAVCKCSDNPTNYYRENECTEFITSVPTIWDETVALEAKIGQYAIVAKRKGSKWFIGGITNGTEEVRNFKLNLSFLKTGKSYKIISFEDGINAGYQAMDYRKKNYNVTSNDVIEVKMARNGGWASVLEEI